MITYLLQQGDSSPGSWWASGAVFLVCALVCLSLFVFLRIPHRFGIHFHRAARCHRCGAAIACVHCDAICPNGHDNS